jgi:hypothetical protein
MTQPDGPEATDTEEIQMNASSPQQLSAEPFDDYDDSFGEALPARPRPRYLTPLTALLMALILGAVGFYVGVRVEKSQTTGGGGSGAFGRAFAGAGATGSSSSRTGSTPGSGALPGTGSLASRFGGPTGGATGTVGSVTSVDGKTIYVKETGGNTVKVKLSGATKITKSEAVGRKKLYPGDQVSISGSSSSNGTVNATSVNDSGASSSGSTGSASGSSSTSSSGNASSAISSLFGGG